MSLSVKPLKPFLPPCPASYRPSGARPSPSARRFVSAPRAPSTTRSLAGIAVHAVPRGDSAGDDPGPDGEIEAVRVARGAFAGRAGQLLPVNKPKKNYGAWYLCIKRYVVVLAEHKTVFISFLQYVAAHLARSFIKRVVGVRRVTVCPGFCSTCAMGVDDPLLPFPASRTVQAPRPCWRGGGAYAASVGTPPIRDGAGKLRWASCSSTRIVGCTYSISSRFWLYRALAASPRSCTVVDT